MTRGEAIRGYAKFLLWTVFYVSFFSTFAALNNGQTMKYSELEKILKKAGCYLVGNNAHPVWYSPITNQRFQTGHHKSEEVKKGTLERILKQAGIKR